MENSGTERLGNLPKYYNSEVTTAGFEPKNAILKIHVFNQYRQIIFRHLFLNENRLEITLIL